jgi:hypothetical protein
MLLLTYQRKAHWKRKEMLKFAKSMVERFATHFNSGDFLSITEHVVFPLPVQVDGQLIVFQDAAQLAAGLAAYHTANVEQDLRPSIPHIVAIDLPRNGRFRLWVDWVYGNGPQSDQIRTKNLYYCSAIGNRIQIEMVQYLRLAATGPMMQKALDERRIA